MKNTIVAKRYAKALFDFALEQNIVEPVKKDIDLLLDVIRENRDFRLLLKSPIINSEKKEAVLTALFSKTMSEVTFRYLLIITRKRRENFLEGIADEFINLYQEFKNIVTTHLQTAVKIDDDIRKQIINLLHQQTGGEIQLIEEVKEELIGGFVLNYSDMKYDASIAKQIADLKKDFNINLYERRI